MRKWVIAGVGMATVAVASVCMSGVSLLRARAAEQNNQPPARSDEPAPRAASLPIDQVVLFSSGVGLFQRQGTVDGDARVDLSFPVADINDLLKSMVLRDLDGGHIAAVSYDSNAPLERTLKSFAVNLTANPSFAELWNQARGERAEVALVPAQGGSSVLTGTVVGVEKQRQPVGTGPSKDVVETAVLNLWCADGLRAVKLSDVGRVRFLNPTLESEFRKALETLALSHDTQKKAVSIRCVGEGKRRVKVGYVVESPIWKTSYRLVLGTKADEKPYLQGWAVVDNPSDEDWREVRMALVSGRPISFQMDLYQPLFVKRPVVVPDLFQSLNPVAYSGAIEKAKQATVMERGDMDGVALGDRMETLSRARAAGGLAATNGAVAAKRYMEQTHTHLAEQLDLSRSVSTAASAARLGDFFQYAIDRPVSLARQKSALLPIVGKDVQATRVSIYNERVQGKFPLLGLRLKNTSGAHLMQGPITVFEGSTYAGDARILDLQPNEERLISYAIDLGTEVNPVSVPSNGRVTQLKAVKGLVYQTTKLREARSYTVKNRNHQERHILIEHPVRHDFRLVDLKPVETAADVYRFELKVPAGDARTLTVNEERDLNTTVALASQSDEQIRLLIQQPIASDALKAGLKQAQTLRWELEKTRREIAEQQRQLNTIVQDQTRLRANLKEMPSTAAAYKRYLQKFDEQETQIEKYQADIKKLQGEEHAHQKVF
ncbi:MAG: DUF4139 domain-containing protein, partial [Gemmataceae bacterium]